MTATTPATPGTPGTPGTPAILVVTATTEAPSMDQRLGAVDTLLADPEAIPDPLEVELYAYREQITG
jgi:hypothetical protein